MLRTLTDLIGPAGKLEALLNTGADDAAYVALVTHPHPLFGGTMHNKVVYHAMKAFSAFQLPVLRFNFRGAGHSQGIHDFGHGEVDDVRTALRWLRREYAKPILFAGFSFGSYVGLRACCCEPGVAGLVALGLPVSAAGRDYTYEFLPQCPQPKLFLSGDHDEFCSAEALAQAASMASKPVEVITVAGADHFFQGIAASPASKIHEMELQLSAWLVRTFHLEK